MNDILLTRILAHMNHAGIPNAILEVRKIRMCMIIMTLIFLVGLKPEVYFKPQEVWEIRGAE